MRHVRSQLPDKGLNLYPAAWEGKALTTVPPGSPFFWIFNPLQNRSIIPFGINEKKQISSKLWQFSLLPFQLD